MKETTTNQTFLVPNPESFAAVIEFVLEQAKQIKEQAAIITLTGDLGAGKTTFTQQLARYLGVKQPVVSPTFGIMKEYQLESDKHFDQLVHIDAYRIEDISEIGPLRFEEIFKQTRTLVCLEWPENIATILPKQKIAVSIHILEKEERAVSVKSYT